jgi:hypothetical protein
MSQPNDSIGWRVAHPSIFEGAGFLFGLGRSGSLRINAHAKLSAEISLVLVSGHDFSVVPQAMQNQSGF